MIQASDLLSEVGQNETPLTAIREVSEIESLPKRLNRYGKAKTRGLAQLQHLAGIASSVDCDFEIDNRGLHRIIQDLSRCGNYLVFRNYYTAEKVRLTHAHFCKRHLLCPLCAIRRASKFVQNYQERYQTIVRDRPDLEPYMVTLTVKNGSNLKERFNHLTDSMKRYSSRRRDFLKKGRGFCELNRAEAGVFSYEFTKGKDGTWHPHVHMLLLCSSPPDFNPKNPKKSQLSREWHSITGDSFIVDARPIVSEQGFCEVFKYALKFSTLEPSDTWHAYQTLQRRRLVSSFGLFRGVEVPEDLTDAPLSDELPYIEMLYRYLEGAGYSLQGSRAVGD